eukprot:scaffold2230_cov86-Isochrysis_galbana.AAC.1
MNRAPYGGACRAEYASPALELAPVRIFSSGWQDDDGADGLMFSFALAPAGGGQAMPFGGRSYLQQQEWTGAKRGAWTLLCYAHDAYGGTSVASTAMIVEPAPSLDAEIFSPLLGQAVLAKGVSDIDRLATLADTVASALNANEVDPRVDATLRTSFLSYLLDSQPSPEPDSLLATAGALLALGGAGQVELEPAGREAGILVYQRLVETSAQAGLTDAMPT